MSILIKGIDLPKATGFHTITIWSDGATFTRTIEGSRESNIDEVKAIQIPTPHGRLIDANKLEAMMYHEAFEIDSDMQKWDSGCWIRYKVFENCMNRLLPDTILEAEE